MKGKGGRQETAAHKVRSEAIQSQNALARHACYPLRVCTRRKRLDVQKPQGHCDPSFVEDTLTHLAYFGFDKRLRRNRCPPRWCRRGGRVDKRLNLPADTQRSLPTPAPRRWAGRGS